MSVELPEPPKNEERQEWAQWFQRVYQILGFLQVPVKTDATRGDVPQAGVVIFNTDDGQLNVSDGTNWTLPDGTTT